MQTYLNPKAELERLHEQGEEGSTVQSCGCCCTRRHQGKPSRQIQLQSALKKLHRTLANAQANNDRENQINSLRRIGLVHCNLGEYAWGVKCLEQSLQIAQASRNRSSIALILNCLGAAYRQTGQEGKALKAYLEALVIFQETRDEHCVARTFNQLGSVYSCLGQLEQALFCSRQALSSFQSLGNSPTDESATLYTIGEIYLQLNRPRQALAFFEQGLAICQKVSNYKGEAITLESMATAYVRLNQERQALKLYQQALAIRKVVGTSANAKARCLDYIGAVHYKLGYFPQALGYHFQALGILQAHHYTTSSTMLLDDVAESERFLQHLVTAYDRLSLHAQGEQCYQQALEIVRTFGDNPSEEALQHFFEQR